MNVRNLFLLGSYCCLGDSYFLYKTAKASYKFFFRKGIPWRLPNYPERGLVVEGFAHSGNNFFRTNLPRQSDTDTTSFHRTWAVKRALQHRVPTAVVIRDPLQVALSWHYRSRESEDGPYPIWLVLVCWIAYYQRIWKFRHEILIIDFITLTNSYVSARDAVFNFSKVIMNEPPDLSGINSFLGARDPIHIGIFSAALLRVANRMYLRYKRFGSHTRASSWGTEGLLSHASD